jgi:hypothetical protein
MYFTHHQLHVTIGLIFLKEFNILWSLQSESPGRQPRVVGLRQQHPPELPAAEAAIQQSSR